MTINKNKRTNIGKEGFKYQHPQEILLSSFIILIFSWDFGFKCTLTTLLVYNCALFILKLKTIVQTSMMTNGTK